MNSRVSPRRGAVPAAHQRRASASAAHQRSGLLRRIGRIALYGGLAFVIGSIVLVALYRAAAAGDALDADPFCRRLRDRQELASTRIARDVTTRSSMAASPSSAHNQTGLDFSLPAKPSTSGVGLAARRHFRIFGTRITPSDSLIAGPRGIQEVLVRRRKKPESGGLPSLAGRDRLPVENGAVSPVQ
jgi:hypothetical protein